MKFVAGLLHVRRNYTDRREKMPKGKRVRTVPMTPDVIDVLGRLKEREHFKGDDDLVLCNTAGSYIDHAALHCRFYRALGDAELPRVRFHDLRHVFGSEAITVLNAYAVQSYMGHQHYSTTQRYLHHKPRREDAAALHRAFGGADTGRQPLRTTVEEKLASAAVGSPEPAPPALAGRGRNTRARRTAQAA